jgi:hypothetical protein
MKDQAEEQQAEEEAKNPKDIITLLFSFFELLGPYNHNSR